MIIIRYFGIGKNVKFVDEIDVATITLDEIGFHYLHIRHCCDEYNVWLLYMDWKEAKHNYIGIKPRGGSK